MRPQITALAALGLLLGAGLGLFVMWRDVGEREDLLAGVPAFIDGVPQGHVYTGPSAEPEDVNPLTSHSIFSRRLVLGYTHDALLDRDPASGALRPALADAWQLSPDGTTCEFTLRAGVRFADGAPLSMDDVLFGWQLARAGHLPLGHIGAAFDRITDARALDERHLRVTFRDVHYAAVQAVGCSWIVPERAYFVARVKAQCAPGEPEPAVDSARFAELLGRIDAECGPGTGPYVLHNEPSGTRHWRPHLDLLLVRNPHSWRRAAMPGTWNFAGIRLLFRDEQATLNALLRGELDWYPGRSVDALLREHPEVATNYRRLVYDYDEVGVSRIIWNCRRAPCTDDRVRRALGMLIDREKILPIFDGAAVPAVALARPGSPEYPDLAAAPFDPPAARQLLREAGFDPEAGKPLRLTLLAPNGDPLRRISELFVAAAKEAGVVLELRSTEWAAVVAEKKRGDWDGLLIYQAFDAWGDPHRYLHSRGLDNDGGFHDADVDRLADAARSELDPARRAALWRELHTRVAELQPSALIVYAKAQVLLNAHIEGAVTGPGGLSLERAYVAPEFQRR